MEESGESPQSPGRRKLLNVLFKGAVAATGITLLGSELTKKSLKPVTTPLPVPTEQFTDPDVKKLPSEFDKIFSELSNNIKPDFDKDPYVTYSFVDDDKSYYLTVLNIEGQKVLQIAPNQPKNRDDNFTNYLFERNTVIQLEKSPVPQLDLIPTYIDNGRKIPGPVPQFHDPNPKILSPEEIKSLEETIHSAFEKRTKNASGETIPSPYPAPLRQRSQS